VEQVAVLVQGVGAGGAAAVGRARGGDDRVVVGAGAGFRGRAAAGGVGVGRPVAPAVGGPGLGLQGAPRAGGHGHVCVQRVERAAREARELVVAAVAVGLGVVRAVQLLLDQLVVSAIVGGIAVAVLGGEADQQVALAQRRAGGERLPDVADDALVVVEAGIGVVSAGVANVRQPGVVLEGQHRHPVGTQVLIGADRRPLAEVAARDQPVEAVERAVYPAAIGVDQRGGGRDRTGGGDVEVVGGDLRRRRA